MIELLVAMVLLAVAIALVGSVLIGAIGGSGSASSGSVSDAAIQRTTAAIEDDVRRAVTVHSSSSKLRDPVERQEALTENAIARSGDPADGGMVLDIDEVVMATPTEVRLRVDAAPTAGTECVTWRAATVGTEFRVTRLVGPACGAGTARIYLRAPAAAPGLVLAPFSYAVLCNPGVCSTAPRGLAATPCRPVYVTSVPTTARRKVVGVRARFHTVSTQGTAAATGEGATSAMIQHRASPEYRRGLGC